MRPFGSFLYFGLVFYLALPVAVARALGVRPRRYLLAVTLVALLAQYAEVWRVLGFALAQWAIALAFLRVRRAARVQPPFYAAVACALLPLAVVKLSAGGASLVGFIGMSYVTFRALDVVFGIQDGLVTELPAAAYVAFLLFFPAISAGPIDRWRRFRGDYGAERTNEALRADLDRATERIFRGVSYAFVLAPLIETYWLRHAERTPGVFGLVSYMYAYSLHLFFDFAGYSALAIGTGYVFGVRMPENFDRPFLATNPADFWRRWHISLSTWLRDHVYGRFVLTALQHEWFADRRVAGYVGSMLAFTLMGLWHGREARYVCYGLYHALLIVGHGILTRPDRPRRVRLSPIASRIIMFHLACFGFLIFSGRLID